ncbi:phospholipase C, phosphocholine-specific [Nocardioides sp. BP30]|uniref:phosphocholine-specific phospholipase C n=1 Tax=Nocardioides sp. BP30 TaxID=3036374 RepID=UPI0024688D2F|nr:phospholipase C, phosphocholine-specific [Nocardioides sp. BP30]WGL52815.1 phospholipase C, phosphocholine-specific [Nocardioides sp. BP30]
MAGVDRRTFLAGTSAAGLAALAAQVGALPGGRLETADAATSGTIADVKHVVVMMQENRSFDHYYGTLRGVRGFADKSTITLPGGYSVFDQPNGAGRQYPFWLESSNGEVYAQCQGDIAHSWSDQHAAWNGGRMDSWMSAKTKIGCLGYLTRSDIPVHYALADAYTICDAYHASGLTATGPNRTYLFSGKIDASSTSGGDESGVTWQTYAEGLEAAGVSWKVYQNAADNFGDNALAYFTQFSDASSTSPLHTKGMASVPATTGVTGTDILAAIRADVVAGTLPQVSWVVTDQLNSEHPIGPPVNGERFVSGLLAALNADSQVFDSTVVFLNYDENDGFFDHVPPPVPASGTTGEFYDGLPVGLGFRVPMIVISPWSRGGWVNSQVFDHTSVIQFLEKWTAAIGKPAPCPNISAWRRSVCGDLTSTFDFTSKVAGMPTLPTPGAAIALATCTPLANPTPQTNALPAQETGTRPARALPYQLNADVSSWSYSGTTVKVNITMSNAGATGTNAAHYAVYANAHRTGGPWQYTVKPGSPVTDFFNVGSGYGEGLYDLTVVGPNRFLRRLTGDANGASKGVEVHPTIAATTRGLTLTLVNGSSSSVTFKVAANQYLTGGPWTYVVAAGAQATATFDVLSTSHGWYDLTVTGTGDSTWSRRFVGHVENGSASITG